LLQIEQRQLIFKHIPFLVCQAAGVACTPTLRKAELERVSCRRFPPLQSTG
jgi:hypothetical protein